MQQLNLFGESAPVLPITYYPDFLTLEQSNELYQHCLQLQWQQNQIRMLGKTIPVPRHGSRSRQIFKPNCFSTAVVARNSKSHLSIIPYLNQPFIMNSLRKTLAEKYGLVADIMHDDYFFVQLPENEDHSLKFLESNLPECIRVELSECFAGSVIAAWEVPLFLLPQVLQQAHDFVIEYWEQVSQQT